MTLAGFGTKVIDCQKYWAFESDSYGLKDRILFECTAVLQRSLATVHAKAEVRGASRRARVCRQAACMCWQAACVYWQAACVCCKRSMRVLGGCMHALAGCMRVLLQAQHACAVGCMHVPAGCMRVLQAQHACAGRLHARDEADAAHT